MSFQCLKLFRYPLVMLIRDVKIENSLIEVNSIITTMLSYPLFEQCLIFVLIVELFNYLPPTFKGFLQGGCDFCLSSLQDRLRFNENFAFGRVTVSFLFILLFTRQSLKSSNGIKFSMLLN